MPSNLTHANHRTAPCVLPHGSTGHDSSNHPHPRPSIQALSDASTSRASIDRVASSRRRRRRRRRLHVARANEYTNENPLVPSTPLTRSTRRRPRARERDPTIDEPSIDDSRARRDAPRGESAIGRRDRVREMRDDARRTNRCERIDANERTMGSIDRRVASSRVRVSRLSRMIARTHARMNE